jgi:ATP-dependent Clp protease protease subunit
MENESPKEVYATLARPIDGPGIHHAFNFYASMQRKGVSIVHLLIQSDGGFVRDGIALHGYLKNLPIQTNTYNLGNVASIAVAVFLAGQVRRAAKNSAFMIHKATNSFQFPMKADFIRERAVVLERDDQAIETTHTSIPDSDWVKYPTVDLTFGAQEAKEFGLIHEIADFTPPRDCELYNI